MIIILISIVVVSFIIVVLLITGSVILMREYKRHADREGDDYEERIIPSNN